MRTTPARMRFAKSWTFAWLLTISASVLTRFTNMLLTVSSRIQAWNRWRFKRSRLDEWMDQQSSQGAQPRKAESHPDVAQPRKPQSVVPRPKRAVGG